MQGVILRLVFTGKFRTLNPIYLLGMTFFGLIACLPLLWGLGTLILGDLYAFAVLVMWIPCWYFGLVLLWNVYLSLFVSDEDLDNSQGKVFF